MKKATILSIKIYQVIHPFFQSLMVAFFGFSSECHHRVSCSEYTILQIQKHGTII